MSNGNAVQLGFALPIHKNDDDDDGSASSSQFDHPEDLLGHRSPRWSDWDGGKIGGVPSWLNPRDLPSPDAPRGKGGDAALRFVAQLYCPADDVTGNEAAFHRSLYVFASPGGYDANDPSGCVRVLRCQLPKRNDFYPTEGGTNDDDDDDNDEETVWTKHTSRYWAESAKDDGLNLCAVCGQRSRGRCPRQNRWFCGPDHQKECLRGSKRRQKESNDHGATTDHIVPARYLPSVCYESELVVEEEPSAADADANTANTADSSAASSQGALFPSQDITDDDVGLEQGDLNALTGNASLAEAATGVTDPTTLEFYARMAIGGKENDVRDQCLRYCRWPEKDRGEGSKAATQCSDEANEDGVGVGPLWLSSNNRPLIPSTSLTTPDSSTTAFPPPCQYCGAPRAFEFQILPQMLHYLLQSPDSDTANGDGTDEKPRVVLTESERAVLMEAQSKIESGVELPEGFREQHEAAVANARKALLGIPNVGDKGACLAKNEDTLRGTKGGLDWGTIAVYTCTASCGDGGVVSKQSGAYREEAAWMQPPLD
mmetsp:Transcript_31680/g.76705  ORF Transcript_31680/g.76705 Transcript_31680/m.76705 type:complete len:542 (+) Transcript_31680:56-1681(+)